MRLPDCIFAYRVGDGESQYDMFGNYGPIVLFCWCGSSFLTEILDYDSMQYSAVPEQYKVAFLEQHQSCKRKCRQCNQVMNQRWCHGCEANARAFGGWA